MSARIRWELVPARRRRLTRRQRLRSAQAHLRALAVVGRHRIHLASMSLFPAAAEVEEFVVKAAAKLGSIGVGEAEMQPLLTAMRAHLVGRLEQNPQGPS